MRWARFLCFALLMTSAAVMAEEPETEVDDVDRTDFSEAHLQDDALKVENPPHSDVTTTALLPDGTELALGKPSVLLVALANAGSKMFNVSTIDGYAEDAAPHDAALQQAPLKGVSVWGCYALREPAHQGKAHVFAVYSTAAQAASQPSAAPRTTLAMLAADDAATAAELRPL